METISLNYRSPYTFSALYDALLMIFLLSLLYFFSVGVLVWDFFYVYECVLFLLLLCLTDPKRRSRNEKANDE